jgi:dTDP-glucose pyrophosphorylase
MKNINVLIPMAGSGSRFAEVGYTLPKPMIDVQGKPMIQVAVETLDIDATYTYVVQKEHHEQYNLANLLNKLTPNCNIVQVDGITEGAACTTLLAKQYINNDKPLIISNSDQWIDWNSTDAIAHWSTADGGILTFKSNNPKHSYAKINEEGLVTETDEKKVISNDATVGVYYWKKGYDYVRYAEQMIEKNIRTNNEFYVCPVFNQAIEDGKKIVIKEIDTYKPLGTPEDLFLFTNMLLEYEAEKNATYFIDLDGTIFKHKHRYSNLEDVELCPGVRDTLDEIDMRGDTIILVSARKESSRKFTETQLQKLMVPYDQLVLGVSQGCRVIVNDILSESSPARAKGVNVITDQGWSVSDLKK